MFSITSADAGALVSMAASTPSSASHLSIMAQYCRPGRIEIAITQGRKHGGVSC
jgi:hypothetical protein